MTARRLLLSFTVLLAAACGAPEAELSTDVRSLARTAGNAAVLRVAETVLIERCMRDAGFDYPLDPTALKQELLEPPTMPSPVSVWPDEAATPAAASDPARADDPQRRNTALERYVNGLDPSRRQAFTTALHGDQETGPWVEVTLLGGTVRRSSAGCGSEAQRRLYGDLDAYLRGRITADNLNSIILERVTGDPVFTAAQSKWRTCMGKSGQPVAKTASHLGLFVDNRFSFATRR